MTLAWTTSSAYRRRGCSAQPLDHQQWPEEHRAHHRQVQDAVDADGRAELVFRSCRQSRSGVRIRRSTSTKAVPSAIASSGSQTWNTGITTSVVVVCGWLSAKASTTSSHQQACPGPVDRALALAAGQAPRAEAATSASGSGPRNSNCQPPAVRPGSRASCRPCPTATTRSRRWRWSGRAARGDGAGQDRQVVARDHGASDALGRRATRSVSKVGAMPATRSRRRRRAPRARNIATVARQVAEPPGYQQGARQGQDVDGDQPGPGQRRDADRRRDARHDGRQRREPKLDQDLADAHGDERAPGPEVVSVARSRTTGVARGVVATVSMGLPVSVLPMVVEGATAGPALAFPTRSPRNEDEREAVQYMRRR